MEHAEWARKKMSFETRLMEITIPADINPGAAKPLIAKLDALYTEVLLTYPEIKTDDDNITQLLDNVVKVGRTGSNPDARASAGVQAAMNYRMPDESTVDLFELKRITNERLVYLNSFIKILEGKHGRLITTSGLMKIESIF